MSSKTRLTTGVRQNVTPPVIPVAPKAPTGFVANPDLTSVALDWNNNLEADLASYKVYQLISSTWTLIHTVTAPTSLYTVTGLTSSTTYSFRVTAFSTSSLESVPSAVLTVTTDSQTGGTTLTGFDRTGTTDISDALETWLNNNTNVPNGTGATTPTRIKFPPKQADGITRAVYRIEGGVTGGVNLSSMVDITLDGGGKVGGRGLDGAQLISKTKVPFTVVADPTLNPRGIFQHNGCTVDNVPPWLPGTSYAVGAIVSSSTTFRRYKSKLAGNVGHDPTDPTIGPTWWLNVSADGIVTSRGYDFVANGVIPGDRIQVIVGAHATRNINGAHLTNGSNIVSVPSGSVSAADTGALVDCAATGFPFRPTLTFVDTSHIALDDYYTGATGNATITLSAKTSTESTRTVSQVGLGGNPRVLTYNGGSMGVGTADFVLNPAGQWNVSYSPTNVIATSFTGSYASSTYAYDQALKSAFDKNRARTMFIMGKNTRLRIRGFQFTGPYPFVYDPTLKTTGYDPDFESQDAMVWQGCVDCEVGDVTVEKFYGNGMEMQPYVENDGSYTATLGLWVHDSKLTNFGRQSLSLTYGGRAIIEDTYLGESSRSLIDCEPTTSRVDPSLTYTMQDVHLLTCTIGYHHLGMFSAHEGLGKVHIDGATGRGIGTSGTAVVAEFIAENCVENPTDNSTYSWEFAAGVNVGGNAIVVKNNSGDGARTAVVHFKTDNGGCSDYQVAGNLAGAGVAQFVDDTGGNGTPFTPFTLPVPAHALRDLVVGPSNTTTATNLQAQPLRGGVACSWTPAATPNTYDYYELSIYGMIAGTPTVPTAPNSPTSHTAWFPQRRLVAANTAWAAITGASNVDGTGWLNTIFDTSAGGFADSYVCRVRGYDVQSATFGPYSAYSNAVTPTQSTNQGTFITGAHLPDGTAIGIPGGTVLTAFSGNINAVSGTITAKKFTQVPTITGTTNFVNCLFQPTSVNHLTGTAPGTQVHNPSASIVTFTNCELDGGGPGGFGSGVDWANFNVQKSIIHGHSSFCAYGGSGCNIVVNQSWLWDVCPWGNAQETSAFAHRDCVPFFGDSNGPSTITNNVLELHSDQNAVVFAQSSQAAITRTHTWSHNWVDGGGGRQLYVDGPPHNGAFANSATYLMQDNKFMRHPWGFWSQGSFAGTSGNPSCIQNDASGATINLGSPDTNRWWEPGFSKPIGT